MSTLKERIEEIQKAMDWDDEAMALVAGVSRSAVSQWRGLGSKIIHTIGKQEAAENLAKETGYEALWIAKGKGDKCRENPPQKRESEWPLPAINEKKVRALDAPDRARLEAAILIAAAQAGVDVKN